MKRVSISNKEIFEPQEGEVFFAEVPIKRIDRKVKAVACKIGDQCDGCAFCYGELKPLCFKVCCLKQNGIELTFKRVRYGEV